MNLYAFLQLVEENKLDEIMPLLETAKDYAEEHNAPDTYLRNNQQDDYAETSMREALYELQTPRDRTREETIKQVGRLLKWISFHTAIG